MKRPQGHQGRKRQRPAISWRRVLLGSIALIVSLTAGGTTAASAQEVGELRDAGTYSAGEFSEMSGLAPANQESLANVYWGIRDFHETEDRRAIYRLDQLDESLTVTAVIEVDVPDKANDDWEAVATNAGGDLYIADTGSRNESGDRQVFKIDAADLAGAANGGSVTPSQTWSYQPSADTVSGNVEAMAAIDGTVFLFNRGDVLRVAMLDPNGSGIVAVPGAPALTVPAQVTGAEVSKDGRLLILIHDSPSPGLTAVEICDRPADASATLGQLLQQVEAGEATTLAYPDGLDFEGVALSEVAGVTEAVLITDLTDVTTKDQVHRATITRTTCDSDAAAAATEGDTGPDDDSPLIPTSVLVVAAVASVAALIAYLISTQRTRN